MSLSLGQAQQGRVRPAGRVRGEPVGIWGTPAVAKPLAGLYTALRCGQPGYPRADAGFAMPRADHRRTRGRVRCPPSGGAAALFLGSRRRRLTRPIGPDIASNV